MINSKIPNHDCKAYLRTEKYSECNDLMLTVLNEWGNNPDQPLRPSYFGGFSYGMALLKESYDNNEFSDYIKHPQKMVQHYTEECLANEINHSQAISKPMILHGLWLTRKSNPKPVNSLTNFIAQAEKLQGYNIVFWTNIDKERFLELNPTIKSLDITVKNFCELTTEYNKLFEIITSPAQHLPHNKLNEYGGVIIDLAKYLIMESQGGVLIDLDFQFGNKFKAENILPYDFIAENRNFNRLENYFFIAKPHHPIFKGILDIMEEMIFNPSCGNQILKDKLSCSTAIAEFFSMMPLGMSYIKFNNKEGNYDVLTGAKKGCPNKQSNLSFSDDVNQKIQAHELLSYKLDSGILDEIIEFSKSYFFLWDDIANYQTFNCIDYELIGSAANHGGSWWNLDLT